MTGAGCMLTTLQDVVRQAGSIAQRHFRCLSGDDIDRKSSVDLVTRVDREVEQFLRRNLHAAFPDVAFLGEEEGTSGRHDAERQFIVVKAVSSQRCETALTVRCPGSCGSRHGAW